MSREPDPYSAPESAPSRTARSPDSLATGVIHFFASLVGGYVVAVIGTMLLFQFSSLAYALLLAPWLLIIGVAIRHAVAGRRRAALGVLLGFGIFAGVVLLLVAACFGIVLTSNPGGFH